MSEASNALSGEVLGVMWLIIKMTWPLWVFLLVALLLRISIPILRSRARARRAAASDVAKATSIGAPASSMNRALAELDALRRAGALTRQEFARAKEALLRPGADVSTGCAMQIRDLYELHRSGALSPSEFNSKKWEILTKS